MKTSYAQRIRRLIQDLPNGSVVTLKLFPPSWPRTVITRELSRLADEKALERVKRGAYSKSTQTRFGPLRSTPLEVLSHEVSGDPNKCFGGLFLYNNLGLTTQVPSVIEIINNKSSYKLKIGPQDVRYVKIRPKITAGTKPYVILLEVLKNSNSISDSDTERTWKWVLHSIDGMNEKEKRMLVKISMDYPPRVRALLGLVFSKMNHPDLARALKKTLNINSHFSAGRLSETLREPANDLKAWRLK